ncbi:hypothetical protein AB9T89_10275 [Flavobacterium oncorhynchi]|uniref:hypothetical protein n=1 Tax=Flavobacterium oncorhynchi TaxID=728056 RepID=UPI00351A584A
MNIESDRIKALIEYYGKNENYPEKSYTTKFCEAFGLNYIQWSSYSNGKQKAGIKIIYQLMNIFPDLNLNWLLKDDSRMFLSQNSINESEELSEKDKKDLENFVNEIRTELEELEVVLSKTEEKVKKAKSKLFISEIKDLKENLRK